MEHTNDLNENQTSVSENVSTAKTENQQTNAFAKDLEVFKQQFLTEIEAKFEQKLAKLIPTSQEKAPDASVVDTQGTDEITVLKNKIEQMEKIQKSLLAHDLGSGTINSNGIVQRTKTLNELIEERINRG